MKWRQILIGVILVGLFCGLMCPRYLYRAAKRHYCDFRVYHHAAQVFSSKGDIYFRDAEEITPFKYSPAFALFVSPLAALPIKGAAVVFFILNLLMTAFVFLIARKVFIPVDDLKWPRILIYILPALILSRFILQTWDTGQVHILMCALTVLGLYAFESRRKKSGAACLAAGILIKYLPAIFLGYFFIRRQWSRILWTLVFLVVFLALPAFYVGVEKAWGYLSSWIPYIINTSLDPASYTDYKNQSIYSLILRFFTDTPYQINVLHLTFRQGQLLGYAFAVGLYILAMVPGRRGRQEHLDWAYLFVLIPLLNPNAWMGNFVFLVVPLMMLVGYLLRVQGRDRFVLGCVVAAFVLLFVPAQDIVGNDLENIAETWSCVAFGALALGAALLKIKFGGEAPAPEGARARA